MSNGQLPCGGAALAQAVRELYSEGQTDYSLEPLILEDIQGQPVGRIADGDAVVFCCRRGEREVQLSEAFCEPYFDRFPICNFKNLTFIILTLYHEKFKHLPVAFAPAKIRGTLGEIASRTGLRQLRVSESEKFAHVTFFLNGGENQPYEGEVDVRVPSLTGIPFDQAPDLSLEQVSQQVISGLQQGYDLIVCNFANGDVIGHTQNREAKIQAAQFIDQRLGQVLVAARQNGYATLVTADHGNLEELSNPDGTPHVAHTANPVPLILIDPEAKTPATLRDGRLADLAPTVLEALGITKPPSMDGATLAPGYNWGGRRRVLLVILDGWGVGKQDATNPIYLAQTPVWDELTSRCPCAELQASGVAVGLKAGKAGNSEAGHMNIGAGRVVLQDDVRLDLAMQDNSFYTNAVLCQAIESARQRHASLHLIGLLSERSSHGSIEYPLALVRMAKAYGLEQVYLHIIFDGRSTEPGSAPAMLEKLDRQLAEIGVGQVVSGVGRSLALDRNGNYARTQRAYAAFVYGSGKKVRAELSQVRHGF